MCSSQPHSSEPPTKMVVMRHLQTEEDIQRCRKYFNNPLKGNADIESDEWNEKEKIFFITFKDPEAAKLVASRRFRIRGEEVEISLYTPPPPPPSPEKKTEKSAAQRTVEVRGIDPTVTDLYRAYFSNPKKGGEIIVDMKMNEDQTVMYITFETQEVAERVVERQHRIGERVLETRLYCPPKPRPTYPDKLLFQNVADNTTQDCLSMFLENVSGQEPSEMLYGEEGGAVLVTFPQPPDFQQILQKSQKKPLEKHYIKVSRVPISNCVLVEDMNTRTKQDSVQLYFENSKRSRGGLVERVHMVPLEDKCFVYFKSQQVVEGVLKQQHFLEGQRLKVKLYLECLGQSGGSEDPTSFTTPKPLHLHSLDKFKVAFLRQTHKAKAAFLQELGSRHAQGRFEGDSLVVDCRLTPAVPTGRILARTWSTDVEQIVSTHLGRLEVQQLSVLRQLWAEAELCVKTAIADNDSESSMVFSLPEESRIVVVGTKSTAVELSQKMLALIAATMEETEHKRREVTEKISLSSDRLGLLLSKGFPSAARKRHQSLRMDVQKDKKYVVFHGLHHDIKAAQVQMFQLLSSVTTKKVTMTNTRRKVLDAKETRRYIIRKFKSIKICADWELGPEAEVRVSSLEKTDLERAVGIIEQSVVERVCRPSPEACQLLQSPGWQSLVARLTNEHPPGVLLITPSRDGGQILVTSINGILHRVVEEVERFLAQNAIYTQRFRFSPSRQRLVSTKCRDQLRALAVSLRIYKAEVSLPAPEDQIHVRGTMKGLEEALKHLQLLNRKILCHQEVVEDPIKVQLLTSDCHHDLRTIGLSCQCVLSLQPEDNQLQVLRPGPLAPDSDESALQTSRGAPMTAVLRDIIQMSMYLCRLGGRAVGWVARKMYGVMRGDRRKQSSVQKETHKESAEVTDWAYGVFSVSLVSGAIAKQTVDVIVNSTSSNLDLVKGAVSSSIVKAAGSQGASDLQNECRAKYPGGIQNGEVARTRGHGLNCREVFHIGLSRFYNPSDLQDLTDTVTQCLSEASKQQYASLAFPALGTGVLGYPPTDVALSMLEAFHLFERSNPSTSLRDVRIVVYPPDMTNWQEFQQVLGTRKADVRQNRKFSEESSKAPSPEYPSVAVKQTVATPATKSVSLFVYAVHRADIDEALRALDQMARGRFQRKEINDKIIQSFDEEDVCAVWQIGERHKAELQIDKESGRIVCDGLHTQVFECLQEITDYIRSVEHQRQKKETASMLANMISWCFLEVTVTDTEMIRYPPKENQMIETAFQGKEKCVEVVDDSGKVYVIDFNAMMEFPKDDPSNTVSVMRKDKLKEQAGGCVPDLWEPLDPNETLRLVDLKAGDAEYQQVASSFNASVKNLTITNIQRVQNRHLYLQYLAKKCHLERQNPGIQNEKTLWHGTSADSITNINHHGFNRSFCGKNATVHGQGVYFAVDASCSTSSTYSPPDTKGHRYVYQCKVLVGHPTQGHRILRVLPSRQGHVMYNSAADYPSNPSIYVIFNDTQVYPEHLITFK